MGGFRDFACLKNGTINLRNLNSNSMYERRFNQGHYMALCSGRNKVMLWLNMELMGGIITVDLRHMVTIDDYKGVKVIGVVRITTCSNAVITNSAVKIDRR